MLFTKLEAAAKRKEFRTALASGRLLRFPGVFSPLVAMLIEEKGFDGVYISGAVLANELGLPDIGLTTLTEVALRGHQVARVTDLPAIIDIDTGFGEAMGAARTVRELEDAGLSGCHLEDQVSRKRCGHLDNKQLVDTATMVQRVRAAAEARRDKNFLIIARTDSRASEGFEASVARAKAYVDAGADMIFPEALQTEAEYAAFRKAIAAPLLANMTEFGKTPLYDTKQLADLGYNLVIYPVTALRLAMGAIDSAYDAIKAQGSQKGVVDRMMTRARLYDLIRYEEYNAFDQSVFNFKL
ncbi:MAG: methylisocitrate lyase [Alphaproteobacteria bacterium]|nr:methylisocitrate lyase [Alphaproteobacteria bacterium]